MRQPKIGKITVSVTPLEITQVERLNAIATRAGVSRSIIARDAIERELHRCEQSLASQKVEPAPLDGGRAAASSAVNRRA